MVWSCSHRSEFNRLAPLVEVVKKDGEVKMTSKAFNSRCILEWLSKVSRVAATRYAEVERLQLQSVCMKLGAVCNGLHAS